MLTPGDVDTGKAILRDYIKATVGFLRSSARLPARQRKVSSVCSVRAATARNLFSIIGYLQKQAGVELHVAPGPG